MPVAPPLRELIRIWVDAWAIIWRAPVIDVGGATLASLADVIADQSVMPRQALQGDLQYNLS